MKINGARYRSFGVSFPSDVVDLIDDECKQKGVSRTRYLLSLWENRHRSTIPVSSNKQFSGVAVDELDEVKHSLDDIKRETNEIRLILEQKLSIYDRIKNFLNKAGR